MDIDLREGKGGKGGGGRGRERERERERKREREREKETKRDRQTEREREREGERERESNERERVMKGSTVCNQGVPLANSKQYTLLNGTRAVMCVLSKQQCTHNHVATCRSIRHPDNSTATECSYNTCT